jgi:hypothetical protein
MCYYSLLLDKITLLSGSVEHRWGGGMCQYVIGREPRGCKSIELLDAFLHVHAVRGCAEPTGPRICAQLQ